MWPCLDLTVCECVGPSSVVSLLNHRHASHCDKVSLPSLCIHDEMWDCQFVSFCIDVL